MKQRFKYQSTFNKRKLNEFAFVVDKIACKELYIETMMEHFYTEDPKKESFFNELGKYEEIKEHNFINDNKTI